MLLQNYYCVGFQSKLVTIVDSRDSAIAMLIVHVTVWWHYAITGVTLWHLQSEWQTHVNADATVKPGSQSLPSGLGNLPEENSEAHASTFSSGPGAHISKPVFTSTSEAWSAFNKVVVSSCERTRKKRVVEHSEAAILFNFIEWQGWRKSGVSS